MTSNTKSNVSYRQARQLALSRLYASLECCHQDMYAIQQSDPDHMPVISIPPDNQTENTFSSLFRLHSHMLRTGYFKSATVKCFLLVGQ